MEKRLGGSGVGCCCFRSMSVTLPSHETRANIFAHTHVFLSPNIIFQQPPRVRKTITPGTVLILLAGRFRGKRVVCLKALESGLLLVSGPYKINGVPLRRVNQAYVIATSTKVDIKGVDVSSINDAYFARTADAPKEAEEEFFAGDAPKPAVVSDARKADQKKVDDALLKAVAAVPMLEAYLAAQFSLSANDKPHLMKF
jgi:large subunit ribosomal protein L6e